MASEREPWNINIHYDALLHQMVEPGSRVLDVGCGDGFLSARLADSGCRVVALDIDEAVLGRARLRWPGRDVQWLHADVLTHPFEPGEFDAVVSNAMLHHLPDAGEGLRRFGELVRPGGRVGVVGFASEGLLDWPRSLAGMVAVFAAKRVRPTWEHSAPVVWPPPLTYGQVRDVSAVALPGRRYRRLLLRRYHLDWTRPTG